jgi:hypothetical protein
VTRLAALALLLPGLAHAGPDYAIGWAMAGCHPTMGHPGLRISVVNEGDTHLGTFRIHVFAPRLDTTPPPAGTFPSRNREFVGLSSLGNRFADFNLSFVPRGPAYVYYVIDPLNEVIEDDETNNVGVSFMDFSRCTN